MLRGAWDGMETPLHKAVRLGLVYKNVSWDFQEASASPLLLGVAELGLDTGSGGSLSVMWEALPTFPSTSFS